MKSIYFIVLCLCLAFTTLGQETNNGKRLWAKSVLNEKAPELAVEEWISDKPKTKDKFILIDFWATWCGPCRMSIPHLNKFQEKFSRKLVVIGISDEPLQTLKNISDPLMKYYSARDSKRIMYNQLEVRAIPHCLLISPAGKVIWEGIPLLEGHELTEELLRKLIAKYKTR